MLVTFHSKAWNSVTMFGDVAMTLLKMAGHSGTIPSAMLARDIPAALVRLKQAVDAADPASKNGHRAPVAGEDEDDDAEPPVGLRLRAYPLIEMLSAAAAQGSDVMWEEGAPLP